MEISIENIKKVVGEKYYEVFEQYEPNVVIQEIRINCYYEDDNYYAKVKLLRNNSDLADFVTITINKENDITFINNEDNRNYREHYYVALKAIHYLKPRVFPYYVSKEDIETKIQQAQTGIDVHDTYEIRQQKMLEERRKQRETLEKMYAMQRHQTVLQYSEAFLSDLIKRQDHGYPTLQRNVKLYILIEEYNTSRYYYDDNVWVIRFKIGNDKLYYVKHIGELLWNIDQKQYKKYGKQLAFSHDYDIFDQDSQKIIDFMRRMNFDDEYHNDYFRKGMILLDKYSFDDLYELCNVISSDCYNFEFNEVSDKIKLDIELNEYNDYAISINKDCIDYEASNKRFWFVKAKHINVIDVSNCRSILELYDYLNQRHFSLQKDNLDKFLINFILPNQELVEVNSNCELPTFNEVDYIQIYADVNDEGQIEISAICYLEDGTYIKGFNNEGYVPYDLNKINAYILEYGFTIRKDHVAIHDVKDHQAISFVSEGLKYLKNDCEVFVSESLMNIIKKRSVSMSVGVKMNNGLLELNITSDNLSSKEIVDVLKAYRRKKKYYRLKDGTVLNLEDRTLEEANQMLEELSVDAKDLKNGQIKVQPYRSFHLKNASEQARNLVFDFRDDYRAYLQTLKRETSKEIEIPEVYDKVLRDYQKDGFRWLKRMKELNFNPILADDMGLGKTLQVIALLDSEKSNKHCALVVTPSSLLYNWDDEIKKFASDLKVGCVSGNANIRKAYLDEYQNYDILITSYDYLKRDIELYHDKEFSYMVIDEAQYIKNLKSKNAQSVKLINAKHRLALSGTPIENSLAELWSIFDFLMPGYLFNYNYFLNHYEKPIILNQDDEASVRLKKLVEPFILRRIKDEVLSELPDKMEEVYPIRFNEAEEKLYLANLMQVNKEVQASLKDDNARFEILALLTKLRQICCEPRVLYDNIETPSSKLKATLDLLRNLKASKQKVLLFSSFTSVLDLIADELSKENFTYAMISGSVNKEKRRELVNEFQEGKYDVFLISLKAGGTGLNLTKASAVIHFDPWWNVSAQNQATDRAYRIGQDQKVTVYKMIMKDSIEEKIQDIQAKKKSLADAFVEGNETSIHNMSIDDIVSLFEIDD